MNFEAATWIETFREQEELAFVPDAVPPDRLAAIRIEAERLERDAIRMSVPLVRRAGTVGATTLRARAPAIVALYRDLIPILSELVGQAIFEKDPGEDHALALYSYRAGDFMSTHYDRCGDAYGAYSVTIGVIDESSSRLACKTPSGRRFDLATRPGSLAIFNGSRIAHSVSRLGAGERRVVLAAGYRTAKDPNACRGWQQTALELAERYIYFGARGLLR